MNIDNFNKNPPLLAFLAIPQKIKYADVQEITYK